ncbi:zinc finger protein 831 [Hyaena hyaena]|uniref:zinc finger protein 831 n=1 Tax=Hyaena hyaena TaxID=95912 RepID=UPI001924E1EC|nr:zinc finger protein 831 [Hyaena hyaena]
MEVPELARPASPARGQPAPAPGRPGASGGQASPHLTLGPVILPPEQGLAPAVFLKALPVPLYHTGPLQPRAPLVTGSLDGGGVPFILSPLLQPEGPGPTQVGKPVAPTLTVNIVGTLPVLSPGLGPTLSSPGKVRNAGKYLCPHCGRDCLKPSVLEKHLRSHTGERPFPCATCGIAFKTQSNLYKHRRTQTHLSHSRLSSESEGGGGGLLEEGDRAGESSRAEGVGDSWSQSRLGRPLSPGAQGAGRCPVSTTHLPAVAKTLGMKLEAVPRPGSTLSDRETPVDSAHAASPGRPLAGTQLRRKSPEQASPTPGRPCAPQQQQQQQAVTSSEKSWDARASEGRLRKCESTDSGYLSRSDSAEQPPAPCSPLRGLCDREAAPGLERQLEQRIAWLISHNQAVVDDSQLDSVRPRKTVLCKQGSIDLPVPYTYKDSFHFDIRALPSGRRKPAALGSARSTVTPPDKARPLFFHSVPTQLSSSVPCVPITRSSSLPFVEGTGTWPELQDAGPRRQKPLSCRPAPARLADVPGSHPRALVRQAAVEDLQCPLTGDGPAPAEDLEGGRAAAGEGAAGKKCGQRRLKMFSQDKWQVYGKETFKRIYQKMKTSYHGGKKAREGTVGSGTEPGVPLQGEVAGDEGSTPAQDGRSPLHGDVSVGATPGPWGCALARVTEPPTETMARAGGSEPPQVNKATFPPTLSCREPTCASGKGPLLPPNGRLEVGARLSPAPGPLEGGGLRAPVPGLPDPHLEGGTCGEGGKKETGQQPPTAPRPPSGGPGEPQPSEDKLPSERKKPKVEKPSCQEQSGPVGAEAETPGGPGQATSLPSQHQDGDPGDTPGELRGSVDDMGEGRAGEPGRLLELGGGSSTVPSVALRQVLWDPCPVATSPARHPQPAARPQAPSILAAPADTAFPPKYLLRLPQVEARTPPPTPQGPRRGQDPLCRERRPEEQPSFVEPGLGTCLPPCPATGLTSGGADTSEEDPGWSRPWGRRKGGQREQKPDLDAATPATGQAPGSSAGSPKETTFLPTPMCAPQKSGTPEPQHLCMGGPSVGAGPPGGVLSPCALSRELGGPPENAPESPPSGPLARLSSCCCFLTAPTAPGCPELACTHSETLRSSGAQGPFPSLRAEPRLTWCCLSRSLPLPTEQKETAASVYLALHFLGGSARDKAPEARPLSRAAVGGRTRTVLGEGGQVQTAKLLCPVASEMASQEPVSEPECKKGPPWRKAKMFRGSGKQKRLSIRSRRYKTGFVQSRVQLRGSRLRRPPRAPRKDRHVLTLEGLGPRGTPRKASSEVAGPNLRGEPSCVTSESPVCLGHGQEEEEGSRPALRSFSSSTSSGPGSEMDQETPAAPSGPGDRYSQDSTSGLGQSLCSDSCVAVATDGLLSRGRGPGVGLPEMRPPPSQEQVALKLYVFSDAQEPSSLESRGTSPRQDGATSVAAMCALGERAGHTAMARHIAEPRGHRAAGEALTPGSPDQKVRAESMSPSVLPGKPSCGQRISGLLLLGSTGKTHPEIPASGPAPASPYQEEGEHKTLLPTGGQYGPFPLGTDSGKCQVSGLTSLKDCVVPSKPGQSGPCPEAPSKTVKRRGLEGLRKQTRVEVSDTSSDDEDRLVIEM